MCAEKYGAFQSATLQRHERVHTGEKSSACSTCDKELNNSGDLKRHERVHTGEKSLACSACDKTFNNSGDLKKQAGLLSCVDYFMSLQIATVVECLVTCGAGKCLLSCVDSFMSLQIATVVECLITFGANK